MDKVFKLVDFNVYNGKIDDANSGSDNEDEPKIYTDESSFLIQMFGLNTKGETCSILIDNYKPFFYVMVSDVWNTSIKNMFLSHIKNKMGKYYENSVTECIIVKRKKLYGFDGGKNHKFIKLEFTNMNAFNKAKNLWYSDYTPEGRKLLPNGYKFFETNTILYEANIPPLLRFFHIRDISPSGWIALPNKKIIQSPIGKIKKTTCNYEFIINYKDIIPLNDKEDRVPYKICSFDIEASSSHGDFPVPIKTYKKLATNIIEYFENLNMDITTDLCKNVLRQIVLSAFNYDNMPNIDIVYPIQMINKPELETKIDKWLLTPIKNYKNTCDFRNMTTIEKMFEMMGINKDDEDDGEYNSKYIKMSNNSTFTIFDMLCDVKFDRDIKLNEINLSLISNFPKLEGDKVTFIGSTFLNYGNLEPRLNHCIVLGSCSNIPTENSVIETYNTEKEVLLAWKELIQRENPDIIIGYNIFGFDYEFMFRRAEENDCVEEFLKLSRNINDICGTKNNDTNKYNIEESSIQIASGQHELKFIKMNGRLQIDLYNFFRREENLSSYKLDYVSGHFIGDYIKDLEYVNSSTKIKTFNMIGLFEGSYVHIEEIGYSVDYYENGSKYKVTNVDKSTNTFEIDTIIKPDFTKKVRWCLAKDDVTPKDIFRLTNGSSDDRAIIAKYCIQDCNLVHYLMNKVDILTGFIEMAKICSVPINFLVMRGQGIKLTSYIAKKCREKLTLMPVMEKGNLDDGYEGAIVLEPKCDLYLDNPVACVDYASLYPSSMISENLSHDSKVWTKEYDLAGNLVCETGEKDKNGMFIYDNLINYNYVNVTYDTYIYVRDTPTSAPNKIKSGTKICRFAQFPEGKAIMPSILEELLTARKNTRKLIPQEKDEFMKNVLDKRQTGYKLTANSLYGQCGAKTSSFYEKDVAASTTSTGRLLLNYAKKIIEEVYGDAIFNNEKYGLIKTKAEYIYGDSVANYTPIYIKVNGVIDIITIDELSTKYGNSEWYMCLEKGKQDKECCELENVETWTENGWTKLYRVIRHSLASNKKMMRILTPTGLVDVTDDHSLLLKSGEEISPKDVCIGTELLHNNLPFNDVVNIYEGLTEDDSQLCGYLFGDVFCELLLQKYDNNNNDKIIPSIIINNNINIRKAFLSGIIDGMYYGCDTDNAGNVIIYQKNQIIASQICWLASSIGYSISLNVRDDNPDIYVITILSSPKQKPSYAVQQIIEIPYEGYVYDLTTENHHFAAGIGNLIVHNTDSVFFTFNLQTHDNIPIRGKKALEITIELAQEAGHLASKFLKSPHDLEYEKTFMPFCLLSKKRYVGMLYETDPNKCKRKEMGIVLKRRDNAPIVKDIYGGIIDILMKKQNIQEAIDFLNLSLDNIVNEKYTMDKLIITKSLRSGYKNPKSIAHKVLADRIASRDPGNKPSSGDRIAFVYINNVNKKALQGNRIETPQFIIDNKLKIDYTFYITNQIMKPVQQLFALVLEKIWNMQNKKSKISNFKKEVKLLYDTTDPDKIDDKLEKLKNKEVKILLFDKYLRETNNVKEGNQSLVKFFGSKSG
jgi:DNA polymerase elongation subunit (family B)